MLTYFVVHVTTGTGRVIDNPTFDRDSAETYAEEVNYMGGPAGWRAVIIERETNDPEQVRQDPKYFDYTV